MPAHICWARERAPIRSMGRSLPPFTEPPLQVNLASRGHWSAVPPLEAPLRTLSSAPVASCAVTAGNTELLRRMLDCSGDANLMSEVGTPLHWAVGCGHPDAAELLLSRGADANQRNADGVPATLMAAAAGESCAGRDWLPRQLHLFLSCQLSCAACQNAGGQSLHMAKSA